MLRRPLFRGRSPLRAAPSPKSSRAATYPAHYYNYKSPNDIPIRTNLKGSELLNTPAVSFPSSSDRRSSLAGIVVATYFCCGHDAGAFLVPSNGFRDVIGVRQPLVVTSSVVLVVLVTGTDLGTVRCAW